MAFTREELKRQIDKYLEYIEEASPFSSSTEKAFIEDLSRIFMYKQLGLTEQYPGKTDEEYKAILDERHALLANSYAITRMVFDVLPSVTGQDKPQVTDEELKALRTQFEANCNNYDKQLADKKLTHFGGDSSEEFVEKYFNNPNAVKPEEAEFHFLSYTAFYENLKLNFLKFLCGTLK